MRIRLTFAGALMTLASFTGSAPLDAQQPDVVGRWDGAILVLGSELGIGVQFSAGEDGLSATIDIPQQGAMGLPLQNVSFESPRVHFELMGGPGLAIFDGTLAGDSIGGSFSQSTISPCSRRVHGSSGFEPTGTK